MLLLAALVPGLVLSVLLPAAITGDCQPYPAMPAGHSTGSITGLVTSTSGTGISGVNISIVNASNLSLVYACSKTDSTGYYGISGVNSTGGGYGYRVYANASGYGDAYSTPVCVEPANTCNVHTLILSGGPTPTPTPSPTPRPGNVSGYVAVAGYGGAIPDATVTLVDALDAFTIYNTTQTDNTGYYRFGGVKIIGAPGYRVHVEKGGYVEVYSSPFNVAQNTSVIVNLTLSNTPAATVAAPAATSVPAIEGVTSTPAEKPCPTPTQGANAGLPGLPGFEAVAVMAGLAIACAAATKR